MIDAHDLRDLNERIAQVVGFPGGVRDWRALNALLLAVRMKDEPAVMLGVSPIAPQPFRDGNRRTGYQLVRWLLLQKGIDLNATDAERAELRESWSTMDFEAFDRWLAEHATKARGAPPTWPEFLISMSHQKNPMERMG